MKFYYRNGTLQTVGPVGYRDLVQLSEQGSISDGTAVMKEGSSKWGTWGNLKFASPDGHRADVTSFSTFLGDSVARALLWITRWLSPNFLRGSIDQAERSGHFAVMAGAVFGLIGAIVLASRVHSFALFAVSGPALIVVIAIAQYAAQRFMGAATALLESSPNRLASRSFLECVALFSVLGALGLLFSGIVACIAQDSLWPLVPSMLTSPLLVYLACCALHPAEVNIAIAADVSSGEEAIALLAFFLKALVRLSPIAFGIGALVGAVTALVSCFGRHDPLAGLLQSELGYIPFLQGASGLVFIVAACLAPVVSYGLFVLGYLGLDLLRAILTVPTKIGELSKS